MTGGIADGEKNRLVSLLGLVKRFFAPGRQSTGLWACWRRYGLFSWLNRFVCMSFGFPFGTAWGKWGAQQNSISETATGGRNPLFYCLSRESVSLRIWQYMQEHWRWPCNTSGHDDGPTRSVVARTKSPTPPQHNASGAGSKSGIIYK